MQGEDEGAGGGAAGDKAQGSPGDPGSSDGHGGHQDSRTGGSTEAGVSPTRGPPVARALGGRGPGGDASPGPGCFAGSTGESPETELLFHCNLEVTFPSAVQAEMARQFLAPRIEPYQGAVWRQLIVFANSLIIRFTAEDLDELQIAVHSCLPELCILICTIVNVLYPVAFTKPTPEKRGSI